MAERIEILRKYIDELIVQVEETREHRTVYTHLYGVSNLCALIALKRNLDAELAALTGLLHDLYTYTHLDSKDHARKGAIEAKKALDLLKITSDEETDIICTAIAEHSNKKDRHTDFTEMLVDADVLQHFLENVTMPVNDKEIKRYKKLKKEFGLKQGEKQK